MTEPVRTLRRLPQEKKVAGVCAGLAHYSGIDPVFVRLGFVLLTFAGGCGLVLYLISWVLIPRAVPGDEPAGAPPAPRSTILGVIGLAAGAAFVFGRPSGFVFDGFVPLVLIGGGIALLLQRAGQSSADPVPAPPQGPPWAPPPGTASAAAGGTGAPTATPGWSAPPGQADATSAVPGVEEPVVPAWASDWYRAQSEARAELGLPPLPPPTDPTAEAASAPRPGARTRSSCRTRRLFVVALVLFFGLVALSAVGAALVLPGGTGERNHRPATWAAVQDRYRLGAGELVLDLRHLPPLARDTPIELDVGIGHIEVLVSDQLPVQLHGHVGVGEVVPPTGRLESVSGLRNDLDVFDPGSTTTRPAAGATTGAAPAAQDDRPRLIIDAEVSVGLLEVIRG